MSLKTTHTLLKLAATESLTTGISHSFINIMIAMLSVYVGVWLFLYLF